jgi:hypothetical protein
VFIVARTFVDLDDKMRLFAVFALQDGKSFHILRTFLPLRG